MKTDHQWRDDLCDSCWLFVDSVLMCWNMMMMMFLKKSWWLKPHLMD